MRRYEVTDFPWHFLAIFIKRTSRRRSNTLNYRTHSHTASRHKLAAVISWPPSPNLEIATNLKADCNRKWSIIVTFMLFIRFKHCTRTYLSVWPNYISGGQLMTAANLCLEAVAPKSLIFMRRYEVTDFPWHFLTIFYKMDVSMKIKYLQLQNSQPYANKITCIYTHVHISCQ